MITDTDYQLKQMVSIYHRDRSDDLSAEYYMETHDVTVVNGKPVLGAGKPYTKEVFKELSEVLAKKKKDAQARALLYGHTDMLYCNQNVDSQHYIWVYPAQEVKLYFSKEAGIPDGTMKIPDLLFMAKGRERLSVFALNGKTVTPETKLYQAPFMNVYESGDVCLGTAGLQAIGNAKTFEEFKHAWHQVFFNSKFSHGVARTQAGLRSLTKKLMASKEPFPIEELNQHKEFETYQDLIDTL